MFIVLSIILVFSILLLLWLISERGKIILPSTEKALKAGGVNFKNFHGYFYARFSKQYIGGLIKIIFPYLV